MIKVDRVREILTEMGITDLEIVQLTTQLEGLKNEEGYFNFEQFVKDAFWTNLLETLMEFIA